MQRFERTFLALALTVGVVLLAKAGWMQGKAYAAQWLIAQAWQRTLSGEQQARPWPWADTWPVARLTVPDGRQLYVLDSASGEALAFGPGLLPRAAKPGEIGRIIVAGHRDSHFRFLQHIVIGDAIELQDSRGNTTRYRVGLIRVADSRRERLQVQHHTPELILVSCYPFDSIRAGGPLRLLVRADPAGPAEHQPDEQGRRS